MMRSLARKLEKIDAIDLHSFGDASNNGVSAVVHAVVHEETDVKQGFVAAKAQLAKKSLIIPRKELVAGHMSANLVKKSLRKSIHLKRLWLAQQYSGFTLDQRKWRVQTICVQSCEKDQRNQLHSVEIRSDR